MKMRAIMEQFLKVMIEISVVVVEIGGCDDEGLDISTDLWRLLLIPHHDTSKSCVGPWRGARCCLTSDPRARRTRKTVSSSNIARLNTPLRFIESSTNRQGCCGS
jgi:hypothetical protein